MIFSGDSVLLASVYKLSELNNLSIKDFNQFLPPKVKSVDTLRIIDQTIPNNEKSILLYGFKKETLLINNLRLKNCLAITIAVSWPSSNSIGRMWLKKGYGVVKWKRTTGRTDVRKF